MSDITNRQRVNRATGQPQRPRRRPHIELGDTRSESFGEWLYSHRLGFVAVIISILIGGLWIATARVNIEIPPIEYIIEFVDQEPTPEEVEKLKQQRDKLQQEIDRRLAAVQQVKNVQSNESAEEGGAESQNYDNETQQMMDKIASDMASNRGSYESGMRDIKGMGKGGSGSGSGESKGDGDKGKFSGAVTVAYNFTDPVRHHRDLYVPAYRSKGGGVVVVDVWLNRSGVVTAARINSSTNSELNATALEAARHHRTLFRIDDSAPQSHRGTITYTFVAQ